MRALRVGVADVVSRLGVRTEDDAAEIDGLGLVSRGVCVGIVLIYPSRAVDFFNAVVDRVRESTILGQDHRSRAVVSGVGTGREVVTV